MRICSGKLELLHIQLAEKETIKAGFGLSLYEVTELAELVPCVVMFYIDSYSTS
jgi:hypothetical protein